MHATPPIILAYTNPVVILLQLHQLLRFYYFLPNFIFAYGTLVPLATLLAVGLMCDGDLCKIMKLTALLEVSLHEFYFHHLQVDSYWL